MTSYVKFVPQIADQFGVTKEHALNVFFAAQQVESRTWFYALIAWCFLTIVSTVIAYSLMWYSENKHISEGTFVFFIMFLIFAVVWLVVLLLGGNIYNGYMNYEYEVYLDYIRGLGVVSG